ncbi:MAG: hypothetical protein JNK72_26625 [Myxococcales bacterium]|nr:hypothetical protein [Myxococcales bacterium]
MGWAALLALHARPARAEGAPDGLYGRLSRDLVLSAELMGGVRGLGDEARAMGSVALRVRTLDMTGVALGYDRGLSGAGRSDTLWAAVDLRPALLARWSSNLETGPRWRDLALDSLGIELGVGYLRPFGAEGSGFAMVLGAGFELPLVWSEGDAVMLRFSARYQAAAAWDNQGTGRDESGLTLGAGLVFRTMRRAGAVRAR